jgi:aryl-alcohol dehydrogenase-like predicted oxidoreductase
MPFRQISIPSLGRSLSNVMAGLSSAEPESHETGLDAFRKLGGNAVHVHGEGGETHSRTALGRWLARHNLRGEIFVCTQVCHEGWDAVAEKTIDRFTAEALRADIAADLALIETRYLDLVYAANVTDSGIAPFIDAMAEEIRLGRVRAYGSRNWTAVQLQTAADYARHICAPGPAVVVTTELALPVAAEPLWPDDIPFAQVEKAVLDLGLAVLAHADGFNQGISLFDDTLVHPRWARRWDRQINADLVQNLRETAAENRITPKHLMLAWLLNRPFPSIAIIGLPELVAEALAIEAAVTMPIDSTALARLPGKC